MGRRAQRSSRIPQPPGSSSGGSWVPDEPFPPGPHSLSPLLLPQVGVLSSVVLPFLFSMWGRTWLSPRLPQKLASCSKEGALAHMPECCPLPRGAGLRGCMGDKCLLCLSLSVMLISPLTRTLSQPLVHSNSPHSDSPPQSQFPDSPDGMKEDIMEEDISLS